MKALSQRHALVLAGLCLLTVYGCGGGGGGGGGGGAIDTGTPVAEKTSVPVTVIDDAIQFATVCLDKNKNGVCDAGEPSGKTDAAGKVTLQVDSADVGKFPMLAMIGIDAVDSTYGPVTTAFTMTAPADQTAVVSPLTTLVQTTVVNAGVSTAEAAASVQSQTGITVSLFQDFTKNTTPEGDTAGLIARMVVVVTQQQAAILNSMVGTTAIDGAVVTTADLNQIIQNKLLEILPALVAAAADPSVLAALEAATTPAQVTAALAAPAALIVASPETGLTAASVAVLVAVNNQNETPVAAAAPAAPDATASLRALTFTNVSNWFVRGITSSVEQNTPDAANNLRYTERRSSRTASVFANWNTGSTPARQSDLHFTGSAWANCGLNGESVSSVRDAAGNSTYDFCNKFETGKSNRATFDVSGKTMVSVITDARAAGYTNLSIGNNSAAALTAELGTNPFPPGSQISYQASTSLTNAPAYYPGIGNRVFESHPTVAAGRTDPAVNAPCVSGTPAASEAATLEGLIAASPGTPCVNAVQTINPPTTTAAVSSGTRNEGWGATTLSLGLVGTAPTGGTPSTYYTINTPIRVAFGAANSARYYACQQRSTDGSTRNCNLVGTGTYSIATLGDARVMSFAGLPLEAAALTFNRVFVERGDKVYFGYQNKSGVFNTARLNLTGGNELLTKLGIGSVNPEVPLALTKASYAGDWQINDSTFPLESTLIRIFSNATSSCTDTDATNPAAPVVSAPYACVITFTNVANGSFTLTDPGSATFSANGTFNFLGGAATGSYSGAGGTTTSGTFAGARR